MYLEIFKEKQKEKDDRMVALAWHVALFERQEKLKPLLEYLLEEEELKEQKDDDEYKKIAEKHGLKHPWG